VGHANPSVIGVAGIQPVACDGVEASVVRWMTNLGIIAVSHPDPVSLVVGYSIIKEPGTVAISQIDTIILAISDIILVDDGIVAAVSDADSLIGTISHRISEDPRISAGVHVNALSAGIPHNVVIDERARTVFQLNSLGAAISHGIDVHLGVTAVIHVDSLVGGIRDSVAKDTRITAVVRLDSLRAGVPDNIVRDVGGVCHSPRTVLGKDSLIAAICDRISEDPRLTAVVHVDSLGSGGSDNVVRDVGARTILHEDALIVGSGVDGVLVDHGVAAGSHPNSVIVTISHRVSQDLRVTAGAHVNGLSAGVCDSIVIDERARTVFQLNSLIAAISHSIIQDPGPSAVVHVDSLVVGVSDRVIPDGGAGTVLYEDALIVGSGVHGVVSNADVVAAVSYADASIVAVCDPVSEDPRIIAVVHVDSCAASTPNNIVIHVGSGIRRIAPTVFHIYSLVAAICHRVAKDPVLVAAAEHVDSLSGSISDRVVRDEVGPAVLQEDALIVVRPVHRVVIDGDPVAASYTDPMVVAVGHRVSEDLRIIAVLHVDSLTSGISNDVVRNLSLTQAVVHVDTLGGSISDRIVRDVGAKTVCDEDALIIGSGIHGVVSYGDIGATVSHADAMIVAVCDRVSADPRITAVVHIDSLIAGTPHNIVIDEGSGIGRIAPTVLHIDALVAAICHRITKDPVLAPAGHVDSLLVGISDRVVGDEVAPAAHHEDAFIAVCPVYRVVIDGDPVAVLYTDPVVVTVCDRVSEDPRIIAGIHVDSLVARISHRIVIDEGLLIVFYMDALVAATNHRVSEDPSLTAAGQVDSLFTGISNRIVRNAGVSPAILQDDPFVARRVHDVVMDVDPVAVACEDSPCSTISHGVAANFCVIAGSHGYSSVAGISYGESLHGEAGAIANIDSVTAGTSTINNRVVPTPDRCEGRALF